MFAIIPQVNFPVNNLNFHWRWRWWDPIQAILFNLFYFTIRHLNSAFSKKLFFKIHFTQVKLWIACQNKIVSILLRCYSIYCKKEKINIHRALVFCYENCSDLLLEKIALRISRVFLDHAKHGKVLTVSKWVLIVLPKITPKVWYFRSKLSLGVPSPWYKLSQN